jgi:hypothetical protein
MVVMLEAKELFVESTSVSATRSTPDTWIPVPPTPPPHPPEQGEGGHSCPYEHGPGTEDEEEEYEEEYDEDDEPHPLVQGAGEQFDVQGEP